MILATTKTYAKVWDVKREDGKSTQVKMSTSRKDQEGAQHYSSWYVSLSKQCDEKLQGLTHGSNIIVTKISLKLEPFTNGEGKSEYPKAPRITVLEAEFTGDSTRAEQTSNQKPVAQSEDEDELPF